MTKKDYSDPKTLQKTIEKCRSLQEFFNWEFNLKLLEQAIEILNEAIENTMKNDPIQEKYIYERNRLHNRYPDLERWLSLPRYNYQLDFKYEYSECFYGSDAYSEEVNRNIILKYINQDKESKIHNFFAKHKEIFIDQFHYALIGFIGKVYYQEWGQKFYNRDWVTNFLNDQEYPKRGYDDTEIIQNAPPIDEQKKIYLHFNPNFREDKPNNLTKKIEKNKNQSNYLTFRNYLTEEWEMPVGYFEFSNQLISKISSLRTLLGSEAITKLDIQSFHFLVDYLYMTNELYEKFVYEEGGYKMFNWQYWDKQWFSIHDLKKDIKKELKKQIPPSQIADMCQLKGNKNEKIFGIIDIDKDGFVNLRLVLNTHREYIASDNGYEEYYPRSYYYFYDLYISDFLEIFMGSDKN